MDVLTNLFYRAWVMAREKKSNRLCVLRERSRKIQEDSRRYERKS